MKFNDKLTAIKLRRRGLSYSEILRVVPVSKSTISLWLRDVNLTPNKQKRLARIGELARYKIAKARRQRRILDTKKIIQIAKDEFARFVQNPIFLTGLALYWGEGDKHKAERVKFTNSDEKMIMFMMRWFREICEVPEGKFRVALHIHNLQSSPNARKFWSKITRVPENQFQKTYIKETSLRHRRNVLYNGTCAIVVNNKALFRRITGWKLGLLDHFQISPRSSMDRTRDF